MGEQLAVSANWIILVNEQNTISVAHGLQILFNKFISRLSPSTDFPHLLF